ncbi:unnamed protein product [Taenia asiatica]|uniref:Uncharacterized protein n=1 Tax=Taenia asiatica TaxID=60517 RepID=A0A0R3WGG1_TAEAS|nr:unnamed protein product [Taenia asiatica]
MPMPSPIASVMTMARESPAKKEMSDRARVVLKYESSTCQGSTALTVVVGAVWATVNFVSSQRRMSSV